MIADFVHLRVQSSYSMLQSALKIEDIVERSCKLGMPAVALADHSNLFGSLEFALAASKKGVQPIHGVLCNLKMDGQKFAEILLLAKDEVGYKNLLKIASYPYTQNDMQHKVHITMQDLRDCNQGLLLLSGYVEGPIGQALLAGDYDAAQVLSRELLEIFADRFYFEIMRHDLPAERMIEQQYLNLAMHMDIPVVATNKVMFSEASMSEAHDVLLCIAQGLRRSDLTRATSCEHYYFKSQAEMHKLFADLPEALDNSVTIAQRCYVMASAKEPRLPSFNTEHHDENELLKLEATNGLNSRLKAKFADKLDEQITNRYLTRLEYEVGVICQMNYAGYFLIVADFIKWSKEHDIAVGPGRGSGAGSMVAWCLDITELDPLEFSLLFERFLNPERISMPDFDIDFCQENRGKVIEYVLHKYGFNRVAQIITFGKMQAKAVIKDVARVLELPYRYADHLSELVPFNAVSPVSLEQAVREIGELKQALAGKGLYNTDLQEDAGGGGVSINALIKEVLDIALKLEGLHRHCSIHAAGIVISGEDLIETVPLYREVDSELNIIQYSGKYAEIGGVVKFDFLGLQTLTVIAKCHALLRAQGINIDLVNLPLDDQKTFAMLALGRSTGVFQFEGTGIRRVLREAKPDCFGDIIALGALYRPGPMDNLSTYINHRHGVTETDYLHPLLKPILEETGVPIYQEQVLEIVKVLAGYSLGEADILRRAMGKKIASEMQAQEELFVAGARKLHGISEHIAREIFRTLAKFAGYGFNKSHAAAYAKISYQTAYLKANYPREFLIACLNLDISDHEKLQLLLDEARKHQISVAPPDINISRGYFTAAEQKDVINFALGAIKGISPQIGEVIAEVRSCKGDFTSSSDFIRKTCDKGITKKILEGLVKSGAFDKLNDNRRSIYEDIPKLLGEASQIKADNQAKQLSLFQHVDEDHATSVEDWGYTERAYQELAVLGLFLSAHPLAIHAEALETHHVLNSSKLAELSRGKSTIKICGVIHQKYSRMSARGRFVVLKLSDCHGLFEATIFRDEVLQQFSPLLEVKTPVILHCEVNKDIGDTRLTVNKVKHMDELIRNLATNLTLKIPHDYDVSTVIKHLQSCFIKDKPDNTYIELICPLSTKFIAKVKLAGHFSFDKATLHRKFPMLLNK